MEQTNYSHYDEIARTYLRFRVMPFDVVLIEWLNEALKAHKAYDFIREKGLCREFLEFESLI